jgi:nuclear GTP-binding protein
VFLFELIQVREHKRKAKKEQKKKGKTKLKKDPGIPNLYPFKEQLLQQIEDKKQQDLKDEQRRKERLQREKRLKSLQNLKSDAEKRGQQYEQKKEWEEAMTNIRGLELEEDSSRKAYYREFKKVVELSDVILEVLDARDPLGCRCPQVEKAVIAAGANKKLILVLNKIDLVPKPNVEGWLKYLRQEFPTVAFKASTQSQKQNLSRKKLPQGVIPDDLGSLSACFGANVLMKLLGNYCRNADIRTSITVGIVGLPNVGKSSIINSLKRSRACSVGATPGVTKVMQEVQLDKHVKMLDCPGIVMAKSGDHSSAVLRNCVKVENLTDVTSPVEAILQRCNRLKVMEFYCIPEFADVHEFLAHVARRIGRLKKGGVPDVEAAAKHVLHDWNG